MFNDWAGAVIRTVTAVGGDSVIWAVTTASVAIGVVGTIGCSDRDNERAIEM